MRCCTFRDQNRDFQVVAKNERKFRMLSVFTGAGGLDLGLEAAGFESLGFIEQCPLCRGTLRSNRPKWRELPWNDIHDAAGLLVPHHLGIETGQLDLLAGAPPCQPFSTAAQWSGKSRRGVDDARAHTLQAFLRLVSKFQPRVVLIENVPTFWNEEFGAKNLLLDYFQSDREIRGKYSISFSILNAADFGVPQQRKRFIFIAHRIGEEWVWPKGKFSNNPITAWDALHAVNSLEYPRPKGKWADLLPSIPEGWNYLWHTSAGEGIELFGSRTRFWSFLLKLSKIQPSWTLAAQPGPSTGPFHWDNRPLTKEELLVLQTFPSNWKLRGSYRDHVRMAGNATPPLLAEHLGRQIIKVLYRAPVPRKLKYSISRSRAKPLSSPMQAVPEKYYGLVGNHNKHPGTGKGPNPRNRLAIAPLN